MEYKGYKIEGVGKGKADYYVYTDLCKGCGLCIAKCPMNLKGEKRQYAQLYSRVGISARLNKLTEEDKKAIISSIIPNSKNIYPTLSEYCAGNTRVLTKLLVRTIRIAELNGVEANEDTVQASISQIIM